LWKNGISQSQKLSQIYENVIDRWDKPLFSLKPDQDLPKEELAQAVLEGKKPKAPISTKPVISIPCS
jgi:hypothetical protein